MHDEIICTCKTGYCAIHFEGAWGNADIDTPRPAMNLKEIAIEWLEIRGYDGLWNGNGQCGCLCEDLMPCGEPSEWCEPGYRGPCTCGEGCDWDIYRKKPVA